MSELEGDYVTILSEGRIWMFWKQIFRNEVCHEDGTFDVVLGYCSESKCALVLLVPFVCFYRQG